MSHSTAILSLFEELLTIVRRTYNALHDVSEEVGSRIAASTIQSLYSHLVDFISQLVRQSVVSREQEMAAKAHTKAWRLGGSQVYA